MNMHLDLICLFTPNRSSTCQEKLCECKCQASQLIFVDNRDSNLKLVWIDEYMYKPKDGWILYSIICIIEQFFCLFSSIFVKLRFESPLSTKIGLTFVIFDKWLRCRERANVPRWNYFYLKIFIILKWYVARLPLLYV